MCLSACASTLSPSHFLIDFSISGTEVTTAKVITSSFGSTLHHPFRYFAPKNHNFGPKGSENPCKHKYANFCFKCLQITRIPVSYRKLGSRNMMVTQLWGRHHVPRNVFLVAYGFVSCYCSYFTCVSFGEFLHYTVD